MIETSRVQFERRDVALPLAEQLRMVASSGGGIDFGSHGDLHARELRDACLAHMPPGAIRLLNARVVGTLDLSASRVDVPLHFFGCEFLEPVNVEGALLHELVISGPNTARGVSPVQCRQSELAGLRANGVTIARDLDISGTRVFGSLQGVPSYTRRSAIWLTEARIGGRLLAAATRIETSADRAIQADRTTISGDVRLINGFYTNAEVRLIAVNMAGSLDLTGGEISADRLGRALDIAEARIAGSVFMLRNPDTNERTKISGRIEMGRAEVGGRMLLRWASLAPPESHKGQHDYGPTGEAEGLVISAPNLRVRGDLMIEDTTIITGGLNFAGAEFNGGLSVVRAEVSNAGSIAFNLEHSIIGAQLSMHEATIRGQINLASARIHGPLTLESVSLDQGFNGTSIEGVGAEFQGDFVAQNLTSCGEIGLRNSRILGTVDMAGAQISNVGGRTLNLAHAHVHGNLRLCSEFSSRGVVLLNRAVVDGRLRCDNGSFEWTSVPVTSERNLRGSAFEAISTEIRSGITLGWNVIGAVDFSDAKTSFLADRPEVDWPKHCYLAGFQYRGFAPLDDAKGPGVWEWQSRAEWLAAQEPFDPRPWEQLASVLRDNGDPHGARHVLIKRATHRLHSKQGAYSSRPRRVGARIVGWPTGYGHQPFRVIFLIVGLILLLTGGLTAMQASMRSSPAYGPVFDYAGVLYPANGEIVSTSCGDGTVRCFSPFLYAVDTVVPLVDLRQRGTWYPTDTTQGDILNIALGVFTLLGWFMSSLFVVALARDS